MMVQRRKTQVDRNVAEFLMGIVKCENEFRVFLWMLFLQQSQQRVRESPSTFLKVILRVSGNA